MPPTETMKMDLHSGAWQCFLQNRESDHQKAERQMEVFADYESQKIKRTMLSTTVADLYSFMKCFVSCLFLRGLWMDISGEVAEIHMRIDAKNLVTTARTIHLPEQKETIHMISMLQNETCSGNVLDLAHISTQNCLADCLTMSSAKADNLITAVKTVRLLEVAVRPNFRTLMEHKALLSTWCRTFMHTGEICFLPEYFEVFSSTTFTRRTIPYDAREKSLIWWAKCVTHVWARESRCDETNVCKCTLPC